METLASHPPHRSAPLRFATAHSGRQGRVRQNKPTVKSPSWVQCNLLRTLGALWT